MLEAVVPLVLALALRLHGGHRRRRRDQYRRRAARRSPAAGCGVLLLLLLGRRASLRRVSAEAGSMQLATTPISTRLAVTCCVQLVLF